MNENIKTYQQINAEMKAAFANSAQDSGQKIERNFLQIVKSEKDLVFNPISDCYSTDAKVGGLRTSKRYIGETFEASVIGLFNMYEKKDIRDNNRIAAVINPAAIDEGVKEGLLKQDDTSGAFYDGYKYKYDLCKWVVLNIYEPRTANSAYTSFSDTVILPLRGLALMRNADMEIISAITATDTIFLSQYIFIVGTQKVYIKKYNLDTFIPDIRNTFNTFWSDDAENADIRREIEAKVIEYANAYAAGQFGRDKFE